MSLGMSCQNTNHPEHSELW